MISWGFVGRDGGFFFFPLDDITKHTPHKENYMENLLARTFTTQDGHGGRAAEHRREMEEIAQKVFRSERESLMQEIDERILAAQYQAYEQALKDVLGVLEYDIHSITRIGIDGCRDIFEDEKAQRFISDKIMQTITKKLKSMHAKM